MKIYLIDFDGVVCDDRRGDYKKAKPKFDNIARINELYEEGNFIRIFTGRGSGTGIDWSLLTYQQAKAWNLKYHEIVFGKPTCDVIIDDKAINVKDVW